MAMLNNHRIPSLIISDPLLVDSFAEDPINPDNIDNLVTGGGDGAEVYALWWALRFLGQVERIGEGPISVCPGRPT